MVGYNHKGTYFQILELPCRKFGHKRSSLNYTMDLLVPMALYCFNETVPIPVSLG